MIVLIQYHTARQVESHDDYVPDFVATALPTFRYSGHSTSVGSTIMIRSARALTALIRHLRRPPNLRTTLKERRYSYGRETRFGTWLNCSELLHSAVGYTLFMLQAVQSSA